MERLVLPFRRLPSSSARAGWLSSTLLLCAVAYLPACGDHHKPNSPGTPTPPVTGSLTFTRADSTALEMGDTIRVCCGVWDPGFIDKNALKIVIGDPSGQRGGWRFFVLVDEVVADSVYSLPTAPVSQSSQSPVNLFVNDTSRGNELSSSVSESRGSITVHSFSCGPPVRIDATIDVVLGSEFGGGPEVRVRGRYRAEVTPAYPCSFGF